MKNQLLSINFFDVLDRWKEKYSRMLVKISTDYLQFIILFHSNSYCQYFSVYSPPPQINALSLYCTFKIKHTVQKKKILLPCIFLRVNILFSVWLFRMVGCKACPPHPLQECVCVCLCVRCVQGTPGLCMVNRCPHHCFSCMPRPTLRVEHNECPSLIS